MKALFLFEPTSVPYAVAVPNAQYENVEIQWNNGTTERQRLQDARHLKFHPCIASKRPHCTLIENEHVPREIVEAMSQSQANTPNASAAGNSQPVTALTGQRTLWCPTDVTHLIIALPARGRTSRVVCA